VEGIRLLIKMSNTGKGTSPPTGCRGGTVGVRKVLRDSAKWQEKTANLRSVTIRDKEKRGPAGSRNQQGSSGGHRERRSAHTGSKGKGAPTYPISGRIYPRGKRDPHGRKNESS